MCSGLQVVSKHFALGTDVRRELAEEGSQLRFLCVAVKECLDCGVRVELKGRESNLNACRHRDIACAPVPGGGDAHARDH